MDIMRNLLILFYVLLSVYGLSQDTENEIIVLDVISEDGKMILSNPINITRRPGYDNQPSFSSDGSQLLYTSIRDDQQADIYLYNFSDSTHKQITKTKESEFSPVFMSNNLFSVVRIDKDSLQRMYALNMKGKTKEHLVNHQDSIGYYQWMNENELAIFVIPEPFELRIVRTDTNLTKVVTSKISPSIQINPKNGKVLFVTEFEKNQWFICELNDINETTFEIIPIVNVLDEDHNFIITSSGEYIVCNGSKVYKYNPSYDKGWIRIYDGANDNYNHFYRLAISPDMKKIALVTK